MEGSSWKEGPPWAPQRQRGRTTGREPTLRHFLGWLPSGERVRKGHSSMAVGRSLTLATFFLSTRIFQSTAAPTPSGAGKKQQLYPVSSFFLLSVCPSGTHRLSAPSTSFMIFPPVAYPVSNPCFIEFKQAVSPHPRQEDCYGLEAQPGLQHRKFQANLSYNGLPKNTKPTNKQKSAP